MKKKKASVSVILPTYNEADNIVPLITDILSVLSHYPLSLIVVDDHSPDHTQTRVQRAIRKNKWKKVRVIVRMKNRGLTNSIREGIEHATGDIIVWMDCDFSHPPTLLPKLVGSVEKGYDLAVGSRFIPFGKQKTAGMRGRDSMTAVFLSTLLNKMLRFLFHTDFHDYTSGFIAVRQGVVRALPLRGNYGEYFIDFMVRAIAQKYSVLEIPYVSPSRRFGESKTGTSITAFLLHGMRYGETVCRLVLNK